MKHSIFALTIAATLLSGSAALAQKASPRTDREAVLQTGTTIATAEKTKLQSGVYSLGGIHNSKSLYLVLTESVNDPDVLVGLMLERDFQDDSVTVGRLVVAREILGGAKTMISPLKVDSFGNLVSASETDADAPVYLVSRRSGGEKLEYPYLVEGKNGASNGVLLGMTREKNTRFQLVSKPSVNMFSATNSRNHEVVFDGATLSLYAGNVNDLQYLVNPLNGEIGGIAALMSTKFDTMGEYMTSSSAVQRIAFFIQSSSGHEMLFIGTPGAGTGVFTLEGYSKQCRTLADFFNRGRF